MPWTNAAPNTEQIDAARVRVQLAMERVNEARAALEVVERREKARGKRSAALSDLAIRFLPKLRLAYRDLELAAEQITGVLSRPSGWDEPQEQRKAGA